MTDHSYIRTRIRSHGCRTVAITQNNADVMLYGDYGWAGAGIPKRMYDILHNKNESHEYIMDVNITEKGAWSIICKAGKDVAWEGIPTSLKITLGKWVQNGQYINSIAFDDLGHWAVVGMSTHFEASDKDIQTWLEEGEVQYGALRSVHMTNDAMVAVYSNGYKFSGNVPQKLRAVLKDETADVYTVKFAGSAWFYADSWGTYCRCFL